jgi:WD40 repeat protein/uncharacterized membrane protein
MKLPELDPVFPLPVIASVIGALALLSLYRTARGATLRPRWLKLPAGLLRLLVLALAALILLNPVQEKPQPAPKSSPIILLDRSASMRMQGKDTPTRWQEATTWLSSLTDAMASRKLPAPEIALFDDSPEPVTDSAALKQMVPEGKDTLLLKSMTDIIRHQPEGESRQIIVISDGCTHDRQQVQQTLATAAEQGVSISTHLVGVDAPLKNTWIAAVDAPRTVLPKSPATVQIELGSTGYPNETPLRLVVREKDGKEVATARRRAGDTEPAELNFQCGMRSTSYEAELIPQEGETELADNKFNFTIEVTASKLRVLFVEGTHVKRTVGFDGHWWNDMELMTRAWDASGEIEYECLTPYSEYNNRPNLAGVTFQNGEMKLNRSKGFPATREEMYRYDVMLISDVPVGNFSQDQMQWVVDWVNERGGGFLMGGGYTTFDVGNYDQTPWEKIIPVDMLAYGAGYMQRYFKIRIPDSVKRHPLWRISEDPAENERILATHPPFLGMNRIKRAKPGAIVLAVRADVEGDEPVMAAQTYGRGRSIAWMPDPNGGWARDYVKWGPGNGPVLGPQTELGHGYTFQFDPEAAVVPSTPEPLHPSPYYGQYWVNLVKWLGANSIRWHRESMAGRIHASSIVPDSTVKVSAEVLSVTQINQLLSMNVGAQLSIEGSPRIRLHYDRDSREFIGEIPIPADLKESEIKVNFDAKTPDGLLRDSVSVGVRQTNREYTETKPDAAFMEQLASAGNGTSLTTPDQAVEWLLKDQETRRNESSKPVKMPLWPQWPFLALLMLLLCGEWAIRRRTVGIVAALFALLLLPDQLHAQTGPAPAEKIPALIEQLGAPKVRLRDEAQEQLLKTPAAIQAIKAASKNHPSEEVRLRAATILNSIAVNRWQPDINLTTGLVGDMNIILVDPQKQSIYVRTHGGVQQWLLPDGKPGMVTGRAITSHGTWWRDLAMNVLTFSPDGKYLISTDSEGYLSFTNLLDPQHEQQDSQVFWDREVTYQLTSGTQKMREQSTTVLSCLTFTPDKKRLIFSDRHGNFYLWDYPDLNNRTCIPLGNTIQSFIFTPDNRFLIASIDTPGEPDLLYIFPASLDGEKTTVVVPNRINTMCFNKAGDKMLATSRSGAVYLWDYADGKLGQQKILAGMKNETTSAIFSADESSVLVSSWDRSSCITEIDVSTGEKLWSLSSPDYSVNHLELLPDGRLASACTDNVLRIWKTN